MKSFFNIIHNFFNPIKQIDDPIEKIFFYFDIASINLSRLITFSYVLGFALIALLIIDIIRFYNHSLDDVSLELAYTHIVYFLLVVFIILSSKIFQRKVNKPNLFRLYVFIVVLLNYSIAIWTTLIDQKANGQITVIIMSYFGIGALLYLLPLDSLILYTLSTTIFFILLPFYQKDPLIITSHYINVPILTLISFFISAVFFKSKMNDFIKSKKIEQVTNQLDDVIQKILPSQVAFKIRKESNFEPIINDNVTIGFIDFVSFSTIMEKTQVELVFSILDELFGKFDQIIKKYNLEKIKTIGDSYMFAGGLFSNQSQVRECVDASLEIIELLEKENTNLKYKTGFEWKVRIGLDKGRAICGIIGNWRFLFDVWGNVVNFAARLEAISHPNKINISKNIYDEIWIYPEYEFEPRGTLPVKNMQAIEMFYVSRSKKLLSIKE